SAGIKLDGVLIIRKTPNPVINTRPVILNHFLVIRKSKDWIYRLVRRSNPRLNVLKNLAINNSNLVSLRVLFFFFRRSSIHNTGLSVRAVTAEIKIAVASV